MPFLLLWLVKTEIDENQKTENTFDYGSRWVSQKVYKYNSGTWTLQTHKKFVYSGMLLAAELDGETNNITKTYTWGEDLSGSIQRAGGVGGLLSETNASGTYYPCYDSNGNIIAYVDTNGNKVASYEYDPFGNIISKFGTKCDDFAFRFSTKYYDNATGLIYYGYRFYSPKLKRWLNRDPLEEKGGRNLYNFARNNAIMYFDTDGRILGVLPVLVAETGLALDAAVDAADAVSKAAVDAADAVSKALRKGTENTLGDTGSVESNLVTFEYKGKTFQIIYVNGINNTLQDVIKSKNDLAGKIEAKYQAKVSYVYNQTGTSSNNSWFNRNLNWAYDIAQVVAQQQMRLNDATSRFLASKTNKTLKDGGCKYVYWVGHSQGGAILSSAWDSVEGKGNVRVITAAGANFHGFPDSRSYFPFYHLLEPVPYFMSSLFNPFTAGKISGISFGGVFGHSFINNYSKSVAGKIDEYLKEDTKQK